MSQSKLILLLDPSFAHDLPAIKVRSPYETLRAHHLVKWYLFVDLRSWLELLNEHEPPPPPAPERMLPIQRALRKLDELEPLIAQAQKVPFTYFNFFNQLLKGGPPTWIDDPGDLVYRAIMGTNRNIHFQNRALQIRQCIGPLMCKCVGAKIDITPTIQRLQHEVDQLPQQLLDL